jgi:predicted nucleic acid-binding protein
MNERGDLQLVDTNVLIYAHDLPAGDKHARSRESIEAIWDSGLRCLSVQVLPEFYPSVTQKA